MTFPLFTSIKPPCGEDELVYLRECLNSWRSAGFVAVAVNGPREAEALKHLDLPVEFVVPPTDGKPRIGAILEAIRTGGATHAGIINSDCRLFAYPDLAANLGADLGGRAVLAWRIDVGGGADPCAEPDGLDAFFFDTACIPQGDPGFTIGGVFWDTWFPVALLAAGAAVGKLEVPLMTHRRHRTAWDTADYLAGVQCAFSAFRSLPRGLAAFRDVPESWWLQTRLSDAQLFRLGRIIADWTRRERTDACVLAKEFAGIETALRLGSSAMAVSGRAAIAAFENSTCWRITAPLRRAVIAARTTRNAVSSIMDRTARRMRQLSSKPAFPTGG